MPNLYRVICWFVLVLTSLSTAHAQCSGTSMNSPIQAGTYYSCNGSYNSVISLGPNTCYGSATKIYFAIQVVGNSNIRIATCGINYNNILSIYDAQGNVIVSPTAICTYPAQYQYQTLSTGTYYIGRELPAGTTQGTLYTYIESINTGASPAGAMASNAIDAGTLICNSSFTDTQNTAAGNCFGNDYDASSGNNYQGQPSDDVFYKFTLPAQEQVSVSTCAFGVPTYVHLLNSNGQWLASNGGQGPLCPTSAGASLQQVLNAGVYYVVVEGPGNSSWNIKTTISAQVVGQPTVYASPTTATIDAGYSASFSATGACSYLWKDANGAVVGSGAQITVTPAATTTYTVTGTSFNGLTTTVTVTVIVNQNQNYLTTNTVLIPGKTTVAAVEAMLNFDTNAGNGATSYAVRQQQTTYLDELGRPEQQVQVQASPTKLDVVTPITYDALGRKATSYLPYTGSTNPGIGSNGLYQADATTQQATFYQRDYSLQAPSVPDRIVNDAAPTAQTVYETSPLGRVLEQGAPGAAWQPGTGHTVKFMERANTAADAVRQWHYDLATQTYSSPGIYAVGQLLVKETRDEQNQAVLGFTDKQGRIVLKKVLNPATNTGEMLTYYAYDDLDNLRLVISPEGCNQLISSGSWNITNDFIQNWCFHYDYDGRRRVRRKQVPGAAPVLLVYNVRNQVVLTQDGNQANQGAGEWSFMKYDGLGRTVMTGIVTLPGQTQADLQTTLDQENVLFEVADAANASGVGYTLTQAYPHVDGAGASLSANSLLSITYYDNYDAPLLAPNQTGPLACTLPATQWLRFTRGLVTGTSVRQVLAGGTTGTWLTTATYYDDRYRPVQTLTQNHLGGINSEVMSYDFAGKLLTSTTQVTQGNASLVGYKNDKRFTYNASGQPEATYQNVHRYDANLQGFVPQGEVLLVKSSYNELGQLIAKRLHSTDNTKYLQKVDYRYNIRGWLTHLNDRGLTNGAAIEGHPADPDGPEADPDLFSLELRYNDYLQGSATPQYAGNIAQALWQTRTSNQANNRLRAYDYNYDQVSRITSAQYKTWIPTGTATGYWDTNQPTDFSVSNIHYDGNGNLLSMNRQGTVNGDNNNPISGNLDQLTYTYTATVNGQLLTGNRLLAVDDGASGTAATHDFEDNGYKFNQSGSIEYTYDRNGNLLTDANKGITGINYTRLNQPSIINFSAGRRGSNEIRYTYTATGVKLRKQVFSNGLLLNTTDYVGPVVFESTFSANPTPAFAQTSEGRVLYQPSSNNPQLAWKYEYHLKDHLGNLRFAFRADKDNGTETQLQAGMEPTNAAKEEEQFQHVAETRLADPEHARTGDYVARLNARSGRREGPSLRLKVAAGDSIRAEVYGRYDRASATGTLLSKGALIVGGTTVGVTGQTNGDQLQSTPTRRRWLPLLGATISIVPQLFKAKPDALPTAYIRYELFNQDSQLVAVKTQAVQRTATDQWQQLKVGAKADGAGFVQVSLLNESGIAAYFDDLTVNKVAPSPYQENHYDPFGLNLVGIEQTGVPNSAFQYNGKEKQEDFNLNWTDYGARMYDTQIGRWHGVDSKAEVYFNYSPYAYVLNTPTNAIDPDGKLVIFVAGQNWGDGNTSGYWRQEQMLYSFHGDLNSPFNPRNNGWSGHVGTFAFDKAVMKHFNDNSNPIYLDGSLGGWRNTLTENKYRHNLFYENRYGDGYRYGNKHAAEIISRLHRSNGIIDEDIKIIAHSMGAAYAKGLIQAIVNYAIAYPEGLDGLSITEYDFAAFQQNESKAIQNTSLFQYDNKRDKVVGGVTGAINNSHHATQVNAEEANSNTNPTGGHSLFDYQSVIYSLPQGNYMFKDGQFVPR